jgi:hypothetical protein
MKKLLLNSLFAALSVSSFSAHAEYMSEDQLRNLVGSNYTNTALFFRGDSWGLHAKYFALSAVPGAAFGYVTGNNTDERRVSSLVVGIVTGTTGWLFVLIDRLARTGIMNKFLKEYSSVSRLKELTNAEAAMLCGAHYKDLGVMKQLLPYLSDFLQEMGTWEVLTELYFDEPDSTVTQSGSSVRPGFSAGRGLHVDYTSHTSTSQVKHAYMRPEVMERRMKVLKAKLGYTD